MAKNVQIDINLWSAIVYYHRWDSLDPWEQEAWPKEDLEKEIQEGIDAKMEKMVTRDLFSRYKRAPVGDPEREKLRKEYLDRRMVTRPFRTEKEDPDEEPPAEYWKSHP